MNIRKLNQQVALQLVLDKDVDEHVRESLGQKLTRQQAYSTDLKQRLSIIDTLEQEIIHFTNALEAIQNLPSSVDMGMPKAYAAYQRLLSSYQDMIQVRQKIINELRASI